MLRNPSRVRMLALALIAVGGLLLAGCTPSPSPSVPARISVVASTNVYGSIVSYVGGGLIDVTSIIDSPAQDPHSFQGNARVQLALSRADIVVENGGGYDSFIDVLLAGLPSPRATVLSVTTISGKPVTADFNEHLWYDFPTMEKFVAALVPALSAAAPAGASTFERNAQSFVVALHGLKSAEAGLAARYGGVGVVMTEAVPKYLLDASGLVVVSPPEFSNAIEAGRDVPPSVMASTLAMLSDGTARVLVYNQQTTSPQTQLVLDRAKQAQVPVFFVTETMPQQLQYLGWMNNLMFSLGLALK